MRTGGWLSASAQVTKPEGVPWGDRTARDAGAQQRVRSRPGLVMDAEHLPLFVAWVLRTNRLMAADPALRKQGNFATAFHGGGWPASVDLSGVSRWETGLAGVPYAAVRRYEELLELPADSLVAPIDTLNRYLAPRLRPEPALRRPARPLDIVRHDHLADIIDRGSSGASVSGHEWDELTAFLATTPQVVLPKPSTATVLAERRLLESLIADGIAWMSRYEALNRMLAHPVFGTPAVVACASMGIDSQNPVVVESLSDLDSSAHPDASRVVISQLLNPASDRAFYGALMSSVRKSRYGHFSPVQEEQLVRVLTDLVLDGGADGPQRQLAAQVLRIVRSSLVGSSTREVVKAIASLPLPPAAAPADTRLTKGLTAMIVMEMAGSAAPARGAREDEVFPFLLNEALFSPIEDVRIYTSMLLRASPYAAPTATALSELVRRPDALTNASLMMSVMPVLRVLGSDAQIPILQDLVLDESVPAPVRARAAYSLGHVGTAADDPPAYWATNVGWTRSGAATLLRRYAKSPSGGATYPPRLWPARGSDRP